MRRFRDVNVGVRANLGDESFDADRGRLPQPTFRWRLRHHLFPQRRELNRGWSPEGKVFRPHWRPTPWPGPARSIRSRLDDDDTWIPDRLQYGLPPTTTLWIENFANK